MSFKTITYETQGPIAILTLNRPDKANAISEQMVADLGQAMDQAESDSDVRVIVLRGAGRGFSAGFDLETGWDESDRMGSIREDLERDFDMIMRFWRPDSPWPPAAHTALQSGSSTLDSWRGIIGPDRGRCSIV